MLLRHLAYWMVRNGYTDAPAEDAEARLTSMGQIDATPRHVFRHLLNRGGVLREPVPGRIDFVHRTFGDYLAAKAAVDEDDIGARAANAHRDDWRDVLVMAAGHARLGQRTKLIERLLASEPDNNLPMDGLKRSLVALDLSALADLRSPKMLGLGDPGQIDLAPLARRSNLVVTVAKRPRCSPKIYSVRATPCCGAGADRQSVCVWRRIAG